MNIVHAEQRDILGNAQLHLNAGQRNQVRELVIGGHESNRSRDAKEPFGERAGRGFASIRVHRLGASDKGRKIEVVRGVPQVSKLFQKGIAPVLEKTVSPYPTKP